MRPLADIHRRILQPDQERAAPVSKQRRGLSPDPAVAGDLLGAERLLLVRSDPRSCFDANGRDGADDHSLAL